MFCKECGNQLRDNALFCPECGTKTALGREQDAATRQAGAPAPQPSPAPQAQPQPAPQPSPAPQAQPQPTPQTSPAPQPQPQPQPAAQAPQPQPGAPAPYGQNPAANGAPFANAPAAPAPQAPDGRPKWLIPVIIAAVVVVLLALLGLGTCAGGSGTSSQPGSHGPSVTEPTGKQETWSVFVYMCGSNLETNSGYASDNLKELMSVDLAENVTFVVETGGSDEWQIDGIDAEHLNRYVVSDGSMSLKDQQSRQSMGKQQTLSDFLAWGVENYPADRYMLVFWDHGGGSLAGACQDELDGDSLSLPEIQGGVASAGVQFEVIGFDTCLMATLETAQMLSPYANFLVASEELEPACGWDWAAWPQWFAGADGQAGGRGSSLGTAICDSYLEKTLGKGVGDTATLSTVNLTLVPDLANAFANVSVDMARATETPETLQPLLVHTSAAESYGRENYIKGYTDMVDLGDLMVSIGGDFQNSESVLNAIDAAVVHQVHGPLCPDAMGLSVFYPLKIDRDTFLKYFQLSTENGFDNTAYLQFLAARTGEYDSVNWAGEGVEDLDPLTEADAKGKIKFNAVINDQGRYELHITSGGEWVRTCEMSFGILSPDGSTTMLGSDNDLDLYIDPQTYEVVYTDREDGGWMMIDGNVVYADLVDAVADENGPSYLLYSTPVELTTKNNRGQTVQVKTNLLSEYDYATKAYTPLMVYEDADETGMAGKSTLVPNNGDQLKFLVTKSNADGTLTSGNSGTVTWSRKLKMESSYLGDGQYLFLPYVVDLFGNRYYPDGAVMTYKDGKRSDIKLVSQNR